MRSSSFPVLMALAYVWPLHAQGTPFDGPIDIAVEERVIEGRGATLAVRISTAKHYPCVTRFNADWRQHSGRIDIELLGVLKYEVCVPEVSPAYMWIPVKLSRGSYIVSITRGQRTDSLQLDVSESQLVLRSRADTKFLQPDTTVFLRPRRNTFAVSCGTPTGLELCTDFDAWLRRQNGIVPLPWPEGGRIGYPRSGGYMHTAAHYLYEYANEEALDGVRRCMRHLGDVLALTVGAGISVHTTNGEVMRASSDRAFHELHIAVPLRVPMSPSCGWPT